jgi:hypothetical protein
VQIRKKNNNSVITDKNMELNKDQDTIQKGTYICFFFISNKILLKKRKTPLSTQEVYTRAGEATHKKKETQQTLKNQKPSNPNPQEAHPSTTREPYLSSAERMHLHHHNYLLPILVKHTVLNED